MTREEKLEAIKLRLGDAAIDFTPFHLSVLMLIGYVEKLKRCGILADGEAETTVKGQDALSVCEEFEWKPNDVEIVTFCKDMVAPAHLEQFVLMLTQMRDNQEYFLQLAKNKLNEN